MLIREYRIPLPFTLDEFEIAHLYTVALSTIRGDDVQIVADEVFRDLPLQGESKLSHGRYIERVYYVARRFPPFMKALLPHEAKVLHVHTWDAYPYIKLLINNPYMGDRFYIASEIQHFPDTGHQTNVFELNPKKLRMRQVKFIDIASDPEGNMRPENPSTFRSQKTGRGPLRGNWKDSVQPCMCVYKLVTLYFGMPVVGRAMERHLEDIERRFQLLFHRQAFCWMDRWYGMTMQDIHSLEDAIKGQLDELHPNGDGAATREEED